MRVLSLLPAGTEIVAALGARDELVGISHECDHPPDICGLPRVTRSAIAAHVAPGETDRAVRERAAAGEPLFALDERLIADLRPDIIITQAVCDVCAVSEDDVRALASRLDPSPRVVTLAATSLQALEADIRLVAAVLGRSAAGEALVASITTRWRRVHERLRAAQAPRPRVAVIEWTDPLFAAGHWVPEMVRRAGGIDVLAAPGTHSHVVSSTTVMAAHPDVVVIAPCGYDVERAAAEGRSVAAAATWARGATVWAVDANALVSRPGPRLGEGLEVFAAILHPSLFPAPPTACAVPLTGGTSVATML